MAKENIKEMKTFSAKVAIFWTLILGITVLFAILFVMKFMETRIFDSYEDIERANLNLVVDMASEEGEYYVYMYSAKVDANGKLVDTGKSDINKANDVFPTVLNYFNYVRRNERNLGNEATFCKIYGYNVKNNEKDSNLQAAQVTVSQLPVLVKVDGDSSSILELFTTSSQIQKELSEIMNGK